MFDSHHMADTTPKSSENDYETKFGTETVEAPPGDDQDPNSQRPKKSIIIAIRSIKSEKWKHKRHSS